MTDLTQQELKLQEIETRFWHRYRIKKLASAFTSFLIVFCGVSAVLVSIFVYHNNLFNRMRYMTFDGTMYTTLISLVTGIVCLREAKEQTEVTHKWVYFLRLSAACTEFVIFIVVMFGLSPLVPDTPDVTSYTGIMMHLVIPFLMLLCFMFNDAPIGKLKRIEPFNGTIYITLYAIVTLILFGTRILPSRLAPYSFLDFDSNSLLFKLACVAGIYAVGYTISLVLSILNRKLSWVWFYDLNKLGRSMRPGNGGY